MWWAGAQAPASATTHLSCVLSSADSAQDLAAELVHYGFLHEVGGYASGLERCRVCRAAQYYRASPPPPLQDDRTKLAAFLETTFLKYRGTQA